MEGFAFGVAYMHDVEYYMFACSECDKWFVALLKTLFLCNFLIFTLPVALDDTVFLCV